MKKVLYAAFLTVFSLASIASAQTLSFSPTSVSLSAMVGTTTAGVATVSVTASSGTLTYTASNNTGVPWLSFGSAGSTTPTNPATQFISGTTPSSFVVFANPATLTAGTYTATLLLSANGVNTNVPVSFVVSSIGVSPQSPVNLSYQVGSGSFPGTYLQVLGPSTTYTTQIQNASNCSWLFVPTNGPVPGTLTVATNPSGVNALSANATPYPAALPLRPPMAAPRSRS